MRRRGSQTPLGSIALLVGCVVAGTAWHELVGHGLVGLALGGRIERVDLLGVRVYPEIAWVGEDGLFGRCDVAGLTDPAAVHLNDLAGSTSTWAAAVAAVALLWLRSWSRWAETALLATSLWWIDLLTYTLPSFGLRRFILFGRSYAEPYDAAVALGIPGPAFQAFVLITCGALATMSLRFWLRHPAGASRPH